MFCMNCGIEITDENMVDPELEVCNECIVLEDAIKGYNVDDFYQRQDDNEFVKKFIKTHCDIEENYY